MPEQPPNPLPEEALGSIVSVLAPLHEAIFRGRSDEDTLFSACRIVTEASDISISKPASMEFTTAVKCIEAIAEASEFQIRRVILSGNWWKSDNGPLLVFRKTDRQACAIIPKLSGGYQLIDPTLSTPTTITEKTAAELEVTAYSFYRPLPDRKLHWRDLLRFALKGKFRDLKRLAIYQALMALLALFVPIATGILFDNVIPNADISGLSQFIVALSVNALAIAIFNIAQVIAIMRIKFKINVSLQSAVWDRLLRLPMGFFRRFTAGDLADRASSIDAIQQEMTGAVLQTLFGGVFSIVSLGLMFYYDALLALGALGLLLIVVATNIYATFVQLKYQRQIYKVGGKLYGFMLQILTGISNYASPTVKHRPFSAGQNNLPRKRNYPFRRELLLFVLTFSKLHFRRL